MYLGKRPVRISIIVITVILIFCSLATVSDYQNVQNSFAKNAQTPHLLNIAHRGASSIAPENTIAAAEKAFQVGADLWELDVQITKDKELILMHDKTLKRTTNVEEIFPDRETYSVDEFTLEEIKMLDAGSWFIRTDPFDEIDAGNVSLQDQQHYQGVPVPTLYEALNFTKKHNWEVIVEIKPITGPYVLVNKLSEMIVEKIVDLVAAMNMEEDVIIASFDHALIKKVKAIKPSIRGAILVNSPLLDPLNRLRKTGADIYAVSSRIFQSEKAEKIQETGYDVFVWTVDSRSKLLSLLNSSGVSGIITNYPQFLHELISASSYTQTQQRNESFILVALIVVCYALVSKMLAML